MKNLVVIGAGPAGAAAALEASQHGLNVTLISAEKIGGRATWHSLLPSKIYLKLADFYGDIRQYAAEGLFGETVIPDLDQIKKVIKQQSSAWSQTLQSELEAAGVHTMIGKAAFRDESSITIAAQLEAEEVVLFDRAIIATGSIPVFLPRIKPDGQHILAPRFAGSLPKWPEHVIVIGGGVTGSEFTYLFSRMGAEVTWITDLDHVLPRVDKDITLRLEEIIKDMGVNIIKNMAVTGVISDMGGVVVTLAGGQAISASHAFIAIGRKPDLEQLDLDKAGVLYNAQGIQVDRFCQTNRAGIYAVGDAAGGPFIANRGMAQARIAACSAAGVDVLPFDPHTIVEAIYTDPQIAQVGLTEYQANADSIPYAVYTAEYRNILKNYLPGSQPGYLKLLCHPDNGKILGAAAIGEQAADLMSFTAVAMKGNLTREDLAGVFPATPTYSEAVPSAFRGY
ncbi:MAG: dihydrolipoyl dehydrogenase family protein [Anaerolineales bacterium]|jgi:pyruvate/2-oxoglutarate dehydrogenase complex dihydrolipoamide dehydrogenase (E3) component